MRSNLGEESEAAADQPIHSLIEDDWFAYLPGPVEPIVFALAGGLPGEGREDLKRGRSRAEILERIGQLFLQNFHLMAMEGIIAGKKSGRDPFLRERCQPF